MAKGGKTSSASGAVPAARKSAKSQTAPDTTSQEPVQTSRKESGKKMQGHQEPQRQLFFMDDEEPSDVDAAAAAAAVVSAAAASAAPVRSEADQPPRKIRRRDTMSSAVANEGSTPNRPTMPHGRNSPGTIDGGVANQQLLSALRSSGQKALSEAARERYEQGTAQIVQTTGTLLEHERKLLLQLQNCRSEIQMAQVAMSEQRPQLPSQVAPSMSPTRIVAAAGDVATITTIEEVVSRFYHAIDKILAAANQAIDSSVRISIRSGTVICAKVLFVDPEPFVAGTVKHRVVVVVDHTEPCAILTDDIPVPAVGDTVTIVCRGSAKYWYLEHFPLPVCIYLSGSEPWTVDTCTDTEDIKTWSFSVPAFEARPVLPCAAAIGALGRTERDRVTVPLLMHRASTERCEVLQSSDVLVNVGKMLYNLSPETTDVNVDAPSADVFEEDTSSAVQHSMFVAMVILGPVGSDMMDQRMFAEKPLNDAQGSMIRASPRVSLYKVLLPDGFLGCLQVHGQSLKMIVETLVGHTVVAAVQYRPSRGWSNIFTSFDLHLRHSYDQEWRKEQGQHRVRDTRWLSSIFLCPNADAVKQSALARFHAKMAAYSDCDKLAGIIPVPFFLQAPKYHMMPVVFRFASVVHQAVLATQMKAERMSEVTRLEKEAKEKDAHSVVNAKFYYPLHFTAVRYLGVLNADAGRDARRFRGSQGASSRNTFVLPQGGDSFDDDSVVTAPSFTQTTAAISRPSSRAHDPGAFWVDFCETKHQCFVFVLEKHEPGNDTGSAFVVLRNSDSGSGQVVLDASRFVVGMDYSLLNVRFENFGRHTEHPRNAKSQARYTWSGPDGPIVHAQSVGMFSCVWPHTVIVSSAEGRRCGRVGAFSVSTFAQGKDRVFRAEERSAPVATATAPRLSGRPGQTLDLNNIQI
jgi:hypothetical protein